MRKYDPNTLVTFRGFVIIFISLYLLYYPANKEADIIAALISIGFLALAALILIGLVINYLILRKTLQIDILSNSDENLYANESLPLTFKTGPIKLFPFYEIAISTSFQNTKLKIPEQIIRSSEPKGFFSKINFTFPHRGLWSINQHKITLNDRFGLFNFKRKVKITNSKEIKILPRKIHTRALPIITSTFTAGDIIPSEKHATGDYYDLKTYHPSDGIKKIVWNIYARTGELISRHPEKTLSPEGKTAIFLIAEKKDDGIARVCLDYIQKLEENNLQVYFSCLGSSKIEKSYLNSEKLLLESVWSSKKKELYSNYDLFIEMLNSEEQNALFNNIIIFSELELFHNQNLLTYFCSKGHEPIIVTVDLDKKQSLYDKISMSKLKPRTENITISGVQHYPV